MYMDMNGTTMTLAFAFHPMKLNVPCIRRPPGIEFPVKSVAPNGEAVNEKVVAPINPDSFTLDATIAGIVSNTCAAVPAGAKRLTIVSTLKLSNVALT